MKTISFNYIFQTDNLLTACILALLWMLIPSGIIILVVRMIPYFSNFFVFKNSITISGFDFFGIIILAPVVETYLLILLVLFLSKLIENKIIISIISAIIWGSLHGLSGITKIFGTTWTFFVLTLIYINWRSRSFKKAYFMTLVPHVLLNLILVVLTKWMLS